MKRRHHILSASLAFGVCLLAGCQSARSTLGSVEPAVRAALEQQARDWNNGDLAGFMEIYARSEQTRFASGGEVVRGWQTVFDRYRKRYGSGEGMGSLRFSDIEITELSPHAALAFGRWHLQRNAATSSGLFTLFFRKSEAGWRIVHDHTSSGAEQ